MTELETLPVEIIQKLEAVAAYVSYGRGYIGVKPYPDATARFALGALREYRESEICEIPHASIEEEDACDRQRITKATEYTG